QRLVHLCPKRAARRLGFRLPAPSGRALLNLQLLVPLDDRRRITPNRPGVRTDKPLHVGVFRKDVKPALFEGLKVAERDLRLIPDRLQRDLAPGALFLEPFTDLFQPGRVLLWSGYIMNIYLFHRLYVSISGEKSGKISRIPQDLFG